MGPASNNLRPILNDSQLVQGLRDQDPSAVRHLTERHLPSVWRFVYVRVNGDRHLAEDIVSETVLALVRAAADETDIRNPLAWLRSVASNKLRDHFRAAARVQHHIDAVVRSGESSDDNDAHLQQELTEKRQEVLRAMDELTDQQRLSLEWKYVDKLSVREIAERLETTEKAAESILFRARRALRERLIGATAPPKAAGNGHVSQPPASRTGGVVAEDAEQIEAAKNHP